MPVALARAIEEDRAAGYLPFCVVATVGTTSTSSIDPVPAIAELCERERLWLHVDAAYAGSAAVVPELRHILEGGERADSLVAQPAQVAFLRPSTCPSSTRGGWTCSTAPSRSCPNTSARSTTGMMPSATTPSTASSSAAASARLKLWMVIRYFGRDGLAARIREHCRLARLFASWVAAAPGRELLAPVPLSLVCFRACPSRDGESSR